MTNDRNEPQGMPDDGQLLHELYQALMRTRLGFVPAGEQELPEVYKMVQREFPELCNDRYLCRDNCSHGYNSPEWRHTVRSALNILKKEDRGDIRKSDRRGFWLFSIADA